MFENIENIKLLNIVSQVSSPYLINAGRSNHGFVFKLSGASRYEFSRGIIELKEGEMLYIPKGTPYTVRRISECDSQYMALCFDADIDYAEPRLYPMHNFSDINYICNNLMRLWLFRSRSDEFKCISFFYDILSKICEMDKAVYRSNQQYQLIEPAVEYIKAHIFDSSLKVQDLPELCGISGTYFRKIFASRFGTSPQKYIINKRLTHANMILNNGDFESIADVAASVGYEDALYFSRTFKEKYGVSPSKVVRMCNGE
ncbi:MAG: helix-turn-helix transcriptional regulator [Lachnospiraceae bacterium]|nr:helix-turn-helix transcriptional regulator [Lachnospiraceae bacterium]